MTGSFVDDVCEGFFFLLFSVSSLSLPKGRSSIKNFLAMFRGISDRVWVEMGLGIGGLGGRMAGRRALGRESCVS